MNTQLEKKEWIIQRCLQTGKSHDGVISLDYEYFSGYCEKLMTREEMLIALKECEERWPNCRGSLS